MRSALPSLAVVTLISLVTSVAAASRDPTAKEYGAIVAAVRSFPTVSRTLRIRFTQIRVSTRDRRFASARTDVREANGPRVGFVEWLLHRGSGGLWRVVWYGTKAPPCRLATASVRRDVFGTPACAG